jgi:hypothetical protein
MSTGGTVDEGVNMARKPTLKSKRTGAAAAGKKKTRPPVGTKAGRPPTQSPTPFDQEAKRRIGQFGRAGEPPMIKR